MDFDDEGSDLLEVIGVARKGLPETYERLNDDVDRLCDDMRGDSYVQLLEQAPREGILKSVDRLTEEWTAQMADESLVRRRKNIFKQLDENIRVLEKMHRLMDQCKPREEEKERLVLHRNEVEQELCHLLEDRLCAQIAIDQCASNLLQTRLQKLVQEQDEETKEWYFEEVMSKFSSHLKAPVDTKPAVEVKTKKAMSCPLPAEIIHFIYSYADVETCVALREVSTDFYTIFQQQSEDFFRERIKPRNPWMGPGDSIFSWKDCALVFAARLKWLSTSEMKDICVRPKEEKRKTVVAYELKYNERLPDNFTGMQQPCKPCNQLTCHHFHLPSDYQYGYYFVKDLTSMHSYDINPDTELEHLSYPTTIIKWIDDGEIVPIFVPTRKMPLDGSCPEFMVNSNTIVVPLRDGEQLVSPRLHPGYTSGFFTNAQDLHEEGNILYAKTEAADEGMFQFKFADMENDRMVDYPIEIPQEYSLSASYDGLVWWRAYRDLIPTFLDLDSPDKIYYKQKKIVTGFFSGSQVKQCDKKRGSHHLGLETHGGVKQLVDFATGCITVFVPPTWWKGERQAYRIKYLLGFLNGHFQARWMSPWTQERTESALVEDAYENYEM